MRWTGVIKRTVAWVCGDERKLWTVEVSKWGGSSYTSFWLHKNAVAFASSRSEPFVDITDEATEETIRVRDNPDGMQPDPVYVYSEPDAEAQAKLLGDHNLHN